MAELCVADVSQDREQPRLYAVTFYGVASPAIEMLKRAQKTFLHGIFRVGTIAHQIMSQRIGLIETRQRRVAKAAGALLVFVMARHRLASCRLLYLKPAE
jgi:hypothetical protein